MMHYHQIARQRLWMGLILFACAIVPAQALAVGTCREVNCPCSDQQLKEGMVDTDKGCLHGSGDKQPDTCASFRAQLRDINQQLASLRRERQEALKQAKDNMDNIQSLQDRLTDVDMRTATIEATIQPVIDQIDELEEEIEALREQNIEVADMADENPTGPGLVTAANTIKMARLQEKIRTLYEQIAGDRAERSGLEKQKTRLMKELATAQAQYQQYQKLLDSFTGRDGKLRNKKTALKNLLKTCESIKANGGR